MPRADDLCALSAVELAALVRSGEVSPVETVTASLERIEALNGKLNAFVHLCPERALDRARALEGRLARAEDVGSLAGVPLGVKDLEDVRGLPTTQGSAPFAHVVATRDSVHVERLQAAGAIVVGKTNTPEFGYTGFTHNRLFGTTRNPWNPERTPGGSSGGSSAAVASRMVALATASDGGGSIRIPACYVGAFGMKPTFGLVPVAIEDALGMQRWVDTVHYGPLTRTVRDAAAFLDVTAGYHPADPTSLPKPPHSFGERLEQAPSGLRIGFSRDLGYAHVQADVLREVEAGVDVFRALGHDVEEIPLALPDVGRAWGYLCGAENFGQLRDLVKGREQELGHAFWRGLQAASRLTPAQHADFQRERGELNRVLREAFSRYDLLLTPTLPTEAFPARGPMPSEVDGTELTSPLHAVAFTYPFNFSGHPAATVRAGLTDAGLPAGLQIVAERHRDDLVLQAARAYETQRPWDDWP